MEGRLQGKRLTARHFLDDVLEHGAEGCNYLLAVDVDMETVDGYEMSSWERGYGDFEMKPDLDTLRPVPWHEGTVLVLADLQWERRLRGGRLAAPDPAPPARPARRARADRQRRHRARVHRLQGHLRGGLEARPTATSSRPTSTTSTTRCSARARVEPLIRRIRNEMAGGRDDGRELEGRVQPRPARDQLPLRRGAARPPTTTRSTRTAPRRSPPRRSMAITFMAKFNEREGNSCHIHCSLADEDGGNAFARRPAAVRALPRRPARLHARDDAVLRAARQLLQALRRRARSRRPRSPGATTTAPARCASSATARRCGSRTGCPGADVNPYLALAR